MKAFYDEKPSVLEAVGNGSFLYRRNIEEQTVDLRAEGEDEPVATKTQFTCDEVTVFEPLTSNRITEAVITDRWPSTYEQKLVNEYNAAALGLVGGAKSSDEAKSRIDAYKAFLSERAAIKAQVDADCAALGIK